MITGQVKGTSVIINNKSVDVSQFRMETSADIFYEVIRVIDGKFLFLPDHLERLKKSVVSSGTGYPGDEVLFSSLRQLLSESELKTGNIKISVFKKRDLEANIIVHFVSHFYPSNEMYKSGVKLLTFAHTRPQPGVKRWDGDFRKRVNTFIHENGIYEALLLNENGYITEGSRSNIFFINQEEQIITAPMDIVLPGITRKYIIEIIRKLGIPFREELANMSNIVDYKSAFITGTSPKVLPVKILDQFTFNTQNQLLTSIMDEFGLLMERHLQGL